VSFIYEGRLVDETIAIPKADYLKPGHARTRRKNDHKFAAFTTTA
jgi:hypothetical protein